MQQDAHRKDKLMKGWHQGLGTIVLAAAAACGSALAGPEVNLVEGRQPRATIVLAERPTRAAQLAAAELQHHIERITGARLPIVREPAAVADGDRILVGATKATGALGLPGKPFGEQEYLIAFRPGTLVLTGLDKPDFGELDYQCNSAAVGKTVGMPDFFDAQGTLYAAYDFLERCCGVRWYLPTDLGTVFDPADRLAVSGEDVRRAPAIKFRFVHMGYPFPADLKGDTVAGENKIPALSRREHRLFYLRHRIGGEPYAANHSLYGWYKRFRDEKSPEFEKKRPEFFAQGHGSVGLPPQVCYGNPAVVTQVVQDARDFFDGKGLKPGAIANGRHFAVVPMDNNSWCKCAACRRWLPEEATRGKGQYSNDSASDYIFQFANAIAREVRKTHPDRFIATLGYSDYCYPPPHVTLEPNVNVGLCLHSRGWGETSKTRDNDLAILQAWLDRPEKPDLFLWLYYCFPSLTAMQGGYRMFPAFFAPDIVDHMALFHRSGIRGMKYEPSYLANSQQSPLLDQLEFYVTWRLADNPALDGHALIEEFFTRYYGPAAKPMREFYMLAASIGRDPANRPEGVRDPVLSWQHLGTPERMEQLGGFMQDALRRVEANGTETEKQRVTLFNEGVWQFMLKGRATYQEQARIPVPTVTVPRIAPPPDADPKGLDWSRGGVMKGWLTANGKPSDKTIEGAMLHDGRNLYVRLIDRMDPAGLVDRHGSIWGSDNYEIFFAARRGKPYRQIGIHFDGRHSAFSHPGGEVPFGGSVVSDTSGPDAWVVYLTVPLAEIGVAVETIARPEGCRIYMNAIRSMRIQPQVAVMWNPTFGPYHAPDRFAEVTLAD